MAEIIPIEAARQDYVQAQGLSGNVYVTPVQVYRDIAAGDLSITALEC